MFTGSQPTKNYDKEKFLRRIYALNYSKPHHKILKNLLKFEKKKKRNLKDHEEISLYCPTKKALGLHARKICIVTYSDTEQRK